MPARTEVQRRLHRLVVTVLADCGLPLGLAVVDYQWTGDGINAILPADIDPTTVLPSLVRSVAARLDADNMRYADRIRLRMAAGVGLVEPTATGYGGPLIVEISRLVNSATLRGSLGDFPVADLGVAVSGPLYALVIQPGYPGIPAGQFTPASVMAKEFSGPAWIWVSARQWSSPAYAPLGGDDPDQVGGYRLWARLGSGAAGRVYLATASPGGNRRAADTMAQPSGAHRGVRGVVPPGDNWMAVKVLSREFTADPDKRRRLAAGALAASVLSAPHLASVTGCDAEASQPWLASTLVRGPSLAAAISETGALPASTACWLALGLAQALVTLHDAGFTHHAITPWNVLLDAGGPVLTDFGTSHVALTGGPGTAADDVRQLGVVAYYAATGRSPWGDPIHAVPSAGTAPAGAAGPTDAAGATDDDMPTGDDEPDLSDCERPLAAVIQACLAADPAARPTAGELHGWLAEVIGPRPQSWLPRPVAARLAEYRELPPPQGRRQRGDHGTPGNHAGPPRPV